MISTSRGLCALGLVVAAACSSTERPHGSGSGGRAGTGVSGTAGSAGSGNAGRDAGGGTAGSGPAGSGGADGSAGAAGIDAAAGAGGVAGTAGAAGSGGTAGSDAAAGQSGSGGAGGTTCQGELKPCGSACVNLSTDAKHCGRCDHDCLGGACELGVCQPVTITSGQYAAARIAVDATHVYWGRGATSQTTASVSRIRIDGTGGVKILQPGESGSGIMVFNSQLYWMSNGAVRTCPAPDCPTGAGTFASSTGTTAGDVIAIQSVGRLYFSQPAMYNASDGALWYAPLTGGAAQTVAGAPTNPQAIVADATHIYWVNSSTYTNNSANSDAKVLKMPIGGGAIVVLADGILGDMTGGIAVGGGAVYFGLSGGSSIATHKLPLPNGVGTAPAPVFSSLRPFELVADATSVYFTSNTSVYRCPHAGCATPPEVIAAGQDTAFGITQDAVSIYWTASGTLGTPASAAIRRLAK